MQDLFQNYVDDLKALRDEFHKELTVQAQERRWASTLGPMKRRFHCS